jgi:hypothetical protein
MPKPRVFISSTFYDLRQIRDDLERFVTEMGYDPVRHETGAIPYGSDLPLEEYAYKEVTTCDILVSVIGGRFGTPSAEDAEQSISQRELKLALEHGIQVFVFVDRNVRAEFNTYQLNKDNAGVRYRFVDDVRVYRFIEDVLALPCNNPISTFEVCSDIVEFLRAQWSGLFQRLLSERRQGRDQRVTNGRPNDDSMPASAVAEVLARQLLGQRNQLPEGLIDIKWTSGSSTLDIECSNTSTQVFDSIVLQVLDVHRWSDDKPQFIESRDIHENGRFTPLTLHTRPVAPRNGYVSSSEAYSLFHDTPLRFLFLCSQENNLQFSGQRGSALGTYTIHTPGTWRVCLRLLLRGERFGSEGSGHSLVGTRFMYFSWDGATAPAPCEAPVAS